MWIGVKGELHTWLEWHPSAEFLMVFFVVLFVKNHPILKNEGLFYAKFYWVWFYGKYFSCCKKIIFGLWGLRTSFGPIGAKKHTEP